jgi:hypothetical protein
MKRSIMCFLVFIFLLSCSSVFAENPLVVLDAKLEILSGQVKLTRVGSTKSDVISRSCQLYAGDLLETLKESKTVLTYTDGTTMRIKERTLVEVQPTSIRVFKGKTWYKFTKRGSEFRIETPSLVAGIRGTEFEVAVSSRKKTSVSVFEGAVIANSKVPGKGVLLTAGQAVSCDKNRTLSNKFNFNLEEVRADWSDKEWQSSAKTDINSIFINYLNFKNEFGENDPRTIEVKEALDKARSQEK